MKAKQRAVEAAKVAGIVVASVAIGTAAIAHPGATLAGSSAAAYLTWACGAGRKADKQGKLEREAPKPIEPLKPWPRS